MNWVITNRHHLEDNCYILKADASSFYWFGLSKNIVDQYKERCGDYFNIVLYGSNQNGDFYIIPYTVISDLLTEDNLYRHNGRQRWVGDIKNHILNIRNSRIERNVSTYFSIPANNGVLNNDVLNDYSIENAKREITVRINQSVFRQKVLDNFQGRCCLTGIDESNLLVASHIIPWASNINTRLSPHNGLCLSVLYDKLFDKGYFTINSDLNVIITQRLGLLSFELRRWLLNIQGKQLFEPIAHEISHESVLYHQENIFDSFS